MDQPTAKYEGWTLIELFGHGHEAGYVTTQYFGDKAMFQVDVPEIPAGRETLTRARWIGEQLATAGSVIERVATAGRSRIINPGAAYSLNPATEEAVRAAITANERREIKLISLAPDSTKALPGEVIDAEYRDTDDEE